MRSRLSGACLIFILLILTAQSKPAGLTQAANDATQVGTATTAATPAMPNQSHYGVLTFTFPPIDDAAAFPYQITFTADGISFSRKSQLPTPSASGETPVLYLNTKPDLVYDGNTISAPYGILAMDFPLGGDCPAYSATTSLDTIAECYANYLQTNLTTVSAGGYVPVIEFPYLHMPNKTMILRTGERGFALLYPIAQSVGGYDRAYFFWVYNADGYPVFFADR